MLDGRETQDASTGLARFEAAGGTTAELLAFYDSLPSVDTRSMLGTWQGAGVPSGHRMDGLLERYGWYGKIFDGIDDVQPLVFKSLSGRMFAVNPALVPMELINRHIALCHTRFSEALFALCGRLAIARTPKARLRMIEFRGVVTAAMVYDSLAIIDVFRMVDEDTLLGLMDLRGMDQPFFFALRRDS